MNLRTSVATALVLTACRAASAQYTVNVPYDAPDFNLFDGVCDADAATPGPQVTLRAAIQNINLSLPGAYTITLPAGTYPLSVAGSGEDFAATGDLDVRRDLTITGAGSPVTTVDGALLGDRVFHCHSGVRLTLRRLRVYGGSAAGAVGGGGVLQGAGPLFIESCTFERNSAAGSATAHGGGVNADGDVFVSGNSLSQENSASGHGGGYYTTGHLEITGGDVSVCTSDRRGGGIYSAGTARIDGVFFVGNSAQLQGGALAHTDLLTGGGNIASLQTCLVQGNGSFGSGGGVYNSATMNVTDTVFLNNVGPGSGAGLDNRGILTVARTTFDDNRANTAGGGLVNEANATATLEDTTFVRNVAGTTGGGISNSGSLSAKRTLIWLNRADSSLQGGGGLYNLVGSAALTNCTITGNTATAGAGGGILNPMGSVSLSWCTVAFNAAPNNPFAGHSIFNGGTGPAAFQLTHTILFSTASPGCAGPDPILTADFNIDGDGTANLLAPHDQSGTVAAPLFPGIEPPLPNGGFNETMALMPLSPALGRGSSGPLIDLAGNIVAEDQRGFPRPIGRSDIGAFEARCRADYNGDTSVDDFDYFDFLNDFFSMAAAADYNGDTSVDDFDYFDFLNDFFWGC
ncbi:MAG: hypothetical protein JNM07_11075 [Phycisphaerae bacterium]|nr:hypothetical protein [Phycisphaerae bacterium]